MHTEHTITHLKTATRALGQDLRVFTEKTTVEFQTVDTPLEAKRRDRRKLTGNSNGVSGRPIRMPKKFGTKRIKPHLLGYYADDIVRFGSLDGHGTHIVSSPLCR